MLNKKGFTLIETLFVLMIICILFSLTMTIHIPKKKDEVYIQEICNFLYEAKLTAISSKETVTLDVHQDKISYHSLSKNKTYLLDDGCYFEPHKMTFNAYGNVKTAKTLRYHHYNHVYEFVYQVGSGCFYVR